MFGLPDWIHRSVFLDVTWLDVFIFGPFLVLSLIPAVFKLIVKLKTDKEEPDIKQKDFHEYM